MSALQAPRMTERLLPHALASTASPLAPPQAASGSAVWRVTATPSRRPDGGLDAGVHLPVMAPMLCGVRVRLGRQGLECILPNPSGGRGVYVAAWHVVTGFAAPTLHDTLLVERLSRLPMIGPAEVRQAARMVALDGHAGPEAAAAARQVQAALELASLRLRAQCLLTLARSGGFHSPDEAASCLDRTGFNRLADRLGWRGQQLAEALQQLSVQYASVAMGAGSARGPAGEGGRWNRLLCLMRNLRQSLAEEQFCRSGPDGIMLGRVIAAADRCIEQAEPLLPEIEATLTDPLPLLEAWRDGIGAGRLQTLEAAFDGWDRICLLWFDVQTPRARQSLIPEIAALARAIGNGDGWSPPGRHGEAGDLVEGSVLDERRRMILRNERIRTQELALELEAG